VGIFVAVLAFFRRLLEIRIDQLGFQIRRLMAVDTGDRPVRSLQRERSLIVIEVIELPPRLRRMTCLASGWLAVASHLHHAVLELAFVRILVAGSARRFLEMIGNLRFRLIFVG